jgi:hypothetical protein
MNSNEAKAIAVAYRKISDSFMAISKELEKIEKLTSVTTSQSKKTATKTRKKTISNRKDPLLEELREARELVKKALEE